MPKVAEAAQGLSTMKQASLGTRPTALLLIAGYKQLGDWHSRVASSQTRRSTNCPSLDFSLRRYLFATNPEYKCILTVDLPEETRAQEQVFLVFPLGQSAPESAEVIRLQEKTLYFPADLSEMDNFQRKIGCHKGSPMEL